MAVYVTRFVPPEADNTPGRFLDIYESPSFVDGAHYVHTGYRDDQVSQYATRYTSPTASIRKVYLTRSNWRSSDEEKLDISQVPSIVVDEMVKEYKVSRVGLGDAIQAVMTESDLETAALKLQLAAARVEKERQDLLVLEDRLAVAQEMLVQRFAERERHAEKVQP